MTDRLAQIQARVDRREAMTADGSYRVRGTVCADKETHGFSTHPRNVATETRYHPSYLSHLEALADAVPALLAMVRERDAALERVRELHQPQEEDALWCILDEECEECYPETGDGTGHAMTVCSECRAKVDDVTGYIPWPCPTISAVTATEGAE
jgi:hypothetical protein